MSLATATVALAGGALIGVGAALVLLFNGRLGGVGGIVASLMQRSPGEWPWRAAFVVGLLAGGGLFGWLRPSSFAASPASLPLVIGAGAAVGFGARLGGGCTSGHGICGVSRLSRRSIVATMTFMATGMLAATLGGMAGGP